MTAMPQCRQRPRPALDMRGAMLRLGLVGQQGLDEAAELIALWHRRIGWCRRIRRRHGRIRRRDWRVRRRSGRIRRRYRHGKMRLAAALSATGQACCELDPVNRAAGQASQTIAGRARAQSVRAGLQVAASIVQHIATHAADRAPGYGHFARTVRLGCDVNGRQRRRG